MLETLASVVDQCQLAETVLVGQLKIQPPALALIICFFVAFVRALALSYRCKNHLTTKTLKGEPGLLSDNLQF